MGQILIRQLDDETLALLKARAKINDRSTEAEARQIVRDAVLPVKPEVRPSLLSLVGAGRRDGSPGMTTEEIVAHVRALREEWD